MPHRFRTSNSATFVSGFLLSWLIGTGCGGASIGGDWFNCDNPMCTQLDDDGLRFRDDGTWIGLTSDTGGNLEYGGTYRESSDEGAGTYDYRDDILTIRYTGAGTVSGLFKISGDNASTGISDLMDKTGEYLRLEGGVFVK